MVSSMPMLSAGVVYVFMLGRFLGTSLYEFYRTVVPKIV